MNKIQEFFDEKSSIWDEKEKKDSEFFDSFVSTYLNLKKGQRTLDLGCGTGVISNSIYKVTNAEVIGMDLSSKMIELADKKYKDNPNIHFVAEDFYNTKLKGFDAIVCHNAYPHFLDKKAFEKKCLSVLNPHGTLIICHSISRDSVNTCHKHVDNAISVTLKEPLEECKDFLKDFNLERSLDDQFYLIVLTKKN